MEFDCLPFMGLMNLGASYRMMFLSGSMRGMAKGLFWVPMVPHTRKAPMKLNKRKNSSKVAGNFGWSLWTLNMWGSLCSIMCKSKNIIKKIHWLQVECNPAFPSRDPIFVSIGSCPLTWFSLFTLAPWWPAFEQTRIKMLFPFWLRCPTGVCVWSWGYHQLQAIKECHPIIGSKWGDHDYKRV